MTHRTIHARASSANVRQVVRDILRDIVGRGPLGGEAGAAVKAALARAVFQSIHDDFMRKSRGGSGVIGGRWPRHSKKYLAYGKSLGSSQKSKLKKKAGLTRQHNQRGLLSPDQNKIWKGIFASSYRRFAMSMSDGEAKARAGQVAWAKLKKLGAKTKLEVFGNRKAPILLETHQLANSLAPGTVTGGRYLKPNLPGGENQIFRIAPDRLTIGTKDPKARAHNEGRGKLPKRQFLPDRDFEVPLAWRDDWENAAAEAAMDELERRLAGV